MKKNILATAANNLGVLAIVQINNLILGATVQVMLFATVGSHHE